LLGIVLDDAVSAGAFERLTQQLVGRQFVGDVVNDSYQSYDVEWMFTRHPAVDRDRRAFQHWPGGLNPQLYACRQPKTQ